jgi:hypothetical protein
MKSNLDLIETTEDLWADTLLMDMLEMVKRWNDKSSNPEIKEMATNTAQLVAYISKLRIDRATARLTAEDQRRQKLDLDSQISKMINND